MDMEQARFNMIEQQIRPWNVADAHVLSLLEVVNNLESGDITIQLADPSRPGIIIPVDQPENQEVLMLIMPMLLND